MDKTKRRGALEDFTTVEEWADDTREARQHLEEGLKILATIIADAIVRGKSIQGKTCIE